MADLTRVLGVPSTRIRRWMRLGLVTPRRTVHRLSFFDLAEVANARRVCRLIASGASLLNIRRGLEQMRRWLPQRDLPFSQLALLEHDGRILVRLNGTVAEPNGQLRFNFDGPEEVIAKAPARDDGEVLFDEALAAEDAGDLALAVERYQRAIAIESADPVLHFNLGNVLFGLRRYGEAASSYQQALRWDPGYAEAWNNLGSVWLALKAWKPAIRAFRQALRLVPNYEDARHNLANVHSRMATSGQESPVHEVPELQSTEGEGPEEIA
jgi:tetratricopeptide (TPR) repeat protein